MEDNAYEIRQAAKSGDLDKIKTLLDAGEKVDGLRNAPLRRAVRHGQIAAASLLMERGAPLAYDEKEFVTVAAKNGDDAMLGLLLSRMQKPFDPELLDDALVEAVRSGNSIAVNILLDAGANPNADDTLSLMAAATVGNVEIIRLLAVYGANLNARDAQALFNTVFSSHPKALDYLLGMDIDVRAQQGVPLKIAISYGDGEAVEALLRAEMPFDPSWTADAAQSDSIETLEILKAHGADWTDYADEMVAMASRNGRARMLQYIFNEALILDKRNINDSLEEPARIGALPVVLLLLENRADPTFNNSAALRAAVAAGQLGIAEILLNAGAKASDLPDTAFIKIVELGNLPLALELLRAGVILNTDPVTPFTSWRVTEEFDGQALFYDKAGNRHPRPVCENRLKFCHMIMQQACQHGDADPAQLANWFAQMMAAANL